MAEGYTIKEMVQELRSHQSAQTETLVRVCSTLENIDKHLNALTQETKSLEQRTSKLEEFQSKAMVVWGVATFVVVTVVNQFL